MSILGEVNQKRLHWALRRLSTTKQVIERTSNCSNYFSLLEEIKFIHSELLDVTTASDPNSEMYNRNFSIAFAHTVHHEPIIFELFMLLYFRPHNSHCLHIDAKV